MRPFWSAMTVTGLLGLSTTGSLAMFDAIVENNQAFATHYETGNDLYGMQKVYVGYYVAGVMDRDLGIGPGVLAAGSDYCAPKEVTLEQARDVVFQYLQSNPGERHKAGAYLVRTALRTVFPCPSR